MGSGANDSSASARSLDWAATHWARHSSAPSAGKTRLAITASTR